MIKGIGVDTVDINRIRRMTEEDPEPAFLRRAFTERERAQAPEGRLRADYFAARFAVKEAVFKAVAPSHPEKTFDLRLVESLHREDGSPYVVMEGPLREDYEAAGVSEIYISVTTEGHYATAFAVAE